MRFQNLLESRSQYLYEGLDASSSYGMRLWENAGIRLHEAALTADQIQKIFQDVESSSTAAGGNRTLLGKGKDAAVAVNQAWEDLKTKIQNTAPIKAVDQKYDDVVAKIEKGLGGPDNAVNQVIQKYRKFAKEHPVAQGFIYAALIAAAGISGAGLGGAAVLGLLKMTDKLLQGEKFSSAAYAGAKTGLLAYGASKLGDYLKDKWNTYANPGTQEYYVNGQQVDKATYDAALKDMDKMMQDAKIDPNNFKPSDADKIAKQVLDDQSFDAMGQAQDLRNQLKGAGGSISDATSAASNAGEIVKGSGAEMFKSLSSDPAANSTLKSLADKIASGTFTDADYDTLRGQLDNAIRMADNADVPGTLKIGSEVFSGADKARIAKAHYDLVDTMMNKAAQITTTQNAGLKRTGNTLSEGQVYMIFQRAYNETYEDFKRQYNELLEDRTDEGPMDYLKKKMTNLTTKVTADKLSQAWKKAGSPSDSDALADFLAQQGVQADIISNIYQGLKLPAPGAGKDIANLDQIKKMIQALPADRKARLLTYLLGGKAAMKKTQTKQTDVEADRERLLPQASEGKNIK